MKHFQKIILSFLFAAITFLISANTNAFREQHSESKKCICRKCTQTARVTHGKATSLIRWGNFTGNRMGTGIDSPTYTFSAKFPFTDFAILAIPHPKTIVCTMRNEHQWQTIRNGSPIRLPTRMRILCVRLMPPTHLARFPYLIYRQTGKIHFAGKVAYYLIMFILKLKTIWKSSYRPTSQRTGHPKNDSIHATLSHPAYS